MNRSYVYKTLAIFCVSLILVYAGFVATHFWQKKETDLQASKSEEKVTYSSISFIRPNYKPNDSKHLTRFEIEIKDDLLSPNGKIVGVWFNDDRLTLNPSDQYGKRGSTFMQLLPGSYTIEWTVKNNLLTGPSETTQTRRIEVKPSDLWIHIYIQGKNITIS